MKNLKYLPLYNQALQLKAQGDISKAILSILDAIKTAESIGSICSTKNERIFFESVSITHSVLAKLYFTAGELFAIAGNMEYSLQYYKLYQYHNSFIKSKWESDKCLFSFRKFNEHSISDLVNNKITVCRSTAMNDPVDSLINLWSEEENLGTHCKDKNHINPLVKSFDYYRIRSFCYDKEKDDETVRNILMWSHYADEHRGFCIKYRFSAHFIKQGENQLCEHMYIRPIKYSSEIINISIPTIDTELAFATKSKCWEYENEARLIVYNPNNTQDFLDIGLDNESSIEAIFFGCRCPESTITTIKNIFINNPVYINNSVKFYKMKVKYSDVYHFEYYEI